MSQLSEFIRDVMNRSGRSWMVSCLVLGILLSGGCSGVDGPDRYQYWGTVTVDGTPIPVCELAFDPDPRKGGTGPGVIVYSKDGKYQTEKHRGIPPGPKSIRILGFDGIPTPDNSYGTLITKSGLRVDVDLPAKDSEQNIIIPTDALVKAIPN